MDNGDVSVISVFLLSLTYVEFLFVFVILPIVVLAVTIPSVKHGRAVPVGIGLLIVVAVFYTTPWDNHLIAKGVWDYPSRIVTTRIWNAPIGEYLFFVSQPLLTSLWLCHLNTVADIEFGIPHWQRGVGVLAGGTVSATGWLLLSNPTYYLGALLLWAGPVLAIQWGFGWPVLWHRRRTWLLGVGVSTLYLTLVDRLAIELGLWVFDPQFLTGVGILGLPIEEALFFTITNVFVVQGLLLFWWVTDRWSQAQELWPLYPT